MRMSRDMAAATGHVAQTALTGHLDRDRFRREYLPLTQAIMDGHQVLVHCINGRHRSCQVVATCLLPFFRSPTQAMNHVWSLRHLAEFTSLRGHVPIRRVLQHYQPTLLEFYPQETRSSDRWSLEVPGYLSRPTLP
jgi:hypothetical protein